MSTDKMTPTPWVADGCRILNSGKPFAFGNGAEYESSCADAHAIVTAVNSTYGAGVNPEGVADLNKAVENVPHWLREAARVLDVHAERNASQSVLSPKLNWYADNIEAALQKSKL